MTATSHTELLGVPSATKINDGSVLPDTRTKAMVMLDDPQQAVTCSALPNCGVGLMSLDFIITSIIKVHPLALKHYRALEDEVTVKQIEQLTSPYLHKEDYYTLSLAGSIATVAAAFHPKDVFVQMSHLTMVEWTKMIGGDQFERVEGNPTFGIRGASRYLSAQFKSAFEMECEAIKFVRDGMGFTNVKLVVPSCITSREADQVIKLMASYGLNRGDKGLEIHTTIETPYNALMASRFARHVDGFLICPPRLARLMLGAEANSYEDALSSNDAIARLISRSVREAKREGIRVGLMYEGYSSHPELLTVLIDQGIDSISFYPSDLAEGIKAIEKAENRFTHTKAYY